MAKAYRMCRQWRFEVTLPERLGGTHFEMQAGEEHGGIVEAKTFVRNSVAQGFGLNEEEASNILSGDLKEVRPKWFARDYNPKTDSPKPRAPSVHVKPDGVSSLASL